MKLILASAGVEGGDLTLKTLDEIKSADEIIVQTALTPAGKYIVDNFPSAVSLDGIYKKSRTYDTLNKNIAAEVLKAAKTKNVIFLTDGGVSENRACGIILKKRKDAIVLSGVTKAAYFAEKAAFTGNYLAISAYEVASAKLTLPLIVYDVDCAITAGEVKLAVSSAFGDDIPVTLFTGGENKQIPLYELDRQTDLGFLSAIAIGELSLAQKTRYDVDDLLEILRILRGENGCPWDRVQTHASIRMDMLEEAYEAADAIDKKDMKNLCEELGDVLMQVVFHAEIETEQGGFTMGDVIQGICEKMVYRHPHVFGSGKADTAEEVLINWEELKKKEKRQETQTEVMQSVPEALPALIRARKVQKKAADVGFDFPVTEDAMQKVYEEVQELEQAVRENGEIEEEFGDILFALVNISRFLKINPEFALTKAIKKFINRFEYIEKSALSEGKALSEMSLEEMDLLWDEAKIKLNPMQ